VPTRPRARNNSVEELIPWLNFKRVSSGDFRAFQLIPQRWSPRVLTLWTERTRGSNEGDLIVKTVAARSSIAQLMVLSVSLSRLPGANDGGSSRKSTRVS